MKDLLLCVHVVVKTLNLEISRWYLTDYVEVRPCGTIIFPHSTNQIIVCLSSPIKGMKCPIN